MQGTLRIHRGGRMKDYFFIYGKQDCTYCEAAKLLLHTYNERFIYLDVGANPKWRDPEWKTVPQIFHDGKYIGGYSALERYLEHYTEV